MLIFEQGYRWDRWTDFNVQYLITRVSEGSASFRGQNKNFTILGVKIPQNSPKLARIGISQPNPRSRKTAIYPSSMNLFISNLTDRLKRGRNIQICKIRSKGVMWGTRDPILEFWDPLISPGRMKLETSNLAHIWTAVSTNEKVQN